jgi:hypothetical protein
VLLVLLVLLGRPREDLAEVLRVVVDKAKAAAIAKPARLINPFRLVVALLSMGRKFDLLKVPPIGMATVF